MSDVTDSTTESLMHCTLSLTLCKCTPCQRASFNSTTDSFSCGYDPCTLACKARPSSDRCWTSLSVSLSLSLSSRREEQSSTGREGKGEPTCEGEGRNNRPQGRVGEEPTSGGRGGTTIHREGEGEKNQPQARERKGEPTSGGRGRNNH